ncbi:MAG: hypothetical protein MUF87_16515 [Anaerolineae bacterium]|nr:hypothetical protein [Anaerolineae bacterium]
MELETALARAIYRLAPLEVIAYSDPLELDTITPWPNRIQLDPRHGEEQFGIFAASDHYLLARAQFDTDERPRYEAVILTRADLNVIAGAIEPLITGLFYHPMPTFAITPARLSPYKLPLPGTWTMDKRLSALTQLLTEDAHIGLRLLGAALHPRGLLIRGFNPAAAARIELAQGLMMLLPANFRAEITFSTHLDTPIEGGPRIIFSDAIHESRWIADFASGHFPPLDQVRSPYIECLEAIWQGSPREFLAELRALELMSSRQISGKGFEETLNVIAERYLQNQRVLTGEGADIPVDQLKVVLTSENLSPELRDRYAELLLQHTLNNRDSESAQLLTQLMDLDLQLDERLQTHLQTALESQPDAVYFIVRTRLAQGIDARWLPRLQAAAIQSMQVAIIEGDNETLTSWFRLIAREPVSYQLGEVLQAGTLAAQTRAHESDHLSYQLVVLAVKRAHHVLDTLLGDDQLLAALPDTAQRAIRTHEAEAIVALAQAQPPARELFLLAVGLAIDAEAPITAPIIRHLWTLYRDQVTYAAPERYQPSALITRLSNGGMDLLSDDALLTLLIALLTDRDDVRFRETLVKAATRSISLIGDAFARADRSPDDLIGLMNQAIHTGSLTPSQTLTIYLRFMEAHQWSRAFLIIGEQIARTFQHHPAVTIPSDLLWKLIDVAHETRSELIARVMAKRLMSELEKTESETQLNEQLTRLCERVQWNSTIRQSVQIWWRELVRAQPLARLQQLHKLLEGKKPLEDLYQVAETALALRRVLGKKTLEDFADAVGTTYALLQVLSDAFDPEPKHPTTFDQQTMRLELEARRDELTPDERRVLAKNLKELSVLIASMAEHRSKASLTRRADEVERALMAGEQAPQSAIDTLKWFSGYLDGMQDHEKD